MNHRVWILVSFSLLVACGGTKSQTRSSSSGGAKSGAPGGSAGGSAASSSKGTGAASGLGGRSGAITLGGSGGNVTLGGASGAGGATATSGGQSATSGGANAQSFPSGVIPEGFGINVKYNDWDALSPVAELTKIVRDDWVWDLIEPNIGAYDWQVIDSRVAKASSNRMHILAIMNWSNHAHGVTVPKDDAARTLYVDFVDSMIGRYAGQGILWEIGNEPNNADTNQGMSAEEYSQLVKAVGARIRGKYPQEKLLGPALLADAADTSGSLQAAQVAWLNTMCSSGALAQLDALTLHFYRQAWPELSAQQIAEARNILTQCGVNIPIFNGETGYATNYTYGVHGGLGAPTGAFPNLSSDQRSAWIIRMYLFNLSQNVPLTINYVWQTEAGVDYGFIGPDRTPKPVVEHVRRMEAALSGMAFKERLLSDPEDYLLRFASNSNEAVVAWHTEATTSHTITLPSGTWTKTSMAGTISTVSTPEVMITELPDYYVRSQP